MTENSSGGRDLPPSAHQPTDALDSASFHHRLNCLQSAQPIPISGTGLTSPRIGLGTHTLHRLLAPSARRNLLAAAHDLGIRYFDTAPCYGAGLAERELGHFASGRRSALVLATKFGISPSHLAALLPAGAYLNAAAGAALKALRLRRFGSGAPHRDYSVATLRHSVESSLRRLRTDYVDILHVHAPTVETLASTEPLVQAMEGLRRAGKVRHFGLSGDALQCLAIARGSPALGEVLQIELPAGAQGQPEGAPLPREAAIGSWEFPAARSPSPQWPLARILAALQRLVPDGLILVSTHREALLREAIELLSHPAPKNGGAGESAPGFSS